MDVNTTIQLISSVGFPIVACLGVAWFCKYLIDNMQKTIDNNTKIITKLYMKLGGDQDDIDDIK